MCKLAYKLLLVFLVFLTACTATTHMNTAKAEPILANASPKVIGGWSPIFFKHYDVAQINNVIALIHSSQVKRIQITYFSNQRRLALQINHHIVKYTHMRPELMLVEYADTPTMSYDRNNVVVTLYYSNQVSDEKVQRQ